MSEAAVYEEIGKTMPIDDASFRDALRHFPSGVTIVSIKVGELIHGLTVSAFASVSPEPPLILVSIDHQHSAYELMERDGATFAVNILHQEQVELSDRFAWVRDEDRFLEGQWSTAVTGAPILEDALAWLDCTIYARLPTANHTIYVGEVQASYVPRPDEPPLVYWNRDYRRIT
jgi:flavin reductase (DIM6/NTAB) family NADH-FMN oxidoreductase RutF